MSAPEPVQPRSQHWGRFSRLDVLAAIEHASGEALAVNDPLPDTLIASAQAAGIGPAELRLWIYDEPHRADWTMEALTEWARRNELGIFKGAAESEGEKP